MKKILFVVDERKNGGASKVLESIFNNIPKLKADILVLHNNGNCLNNIKNAKIIYGSRFFDVCDLSLNSVIKSLNFIKIIKKLYLIFLMKTGLIKHKIKTERKKMNIKDYAIEVSFKDGFGTFFVGYGDSKNKVRWLHNDFSMNNPGKHYKKSYEDAISNFDIIVAIGESIKKNFNEKFGMSEKTIVIPNIINTPKFKPKIERKNNFEITCIGRLAKVKRYDMLIDIIYKLDKNGLFKNSLLQIIGDGEEKNSLNEKINELGLNDKIVLLGNKENPWNYTNTSDIFIMCSEYEACPLTLIESQLVGLPVLSVDFSSVRELLSPNNGFIVDNNKESLYNKLEELIKNPTKLNKCKDSLKNYKYDNEEIIKKICDLLDLQ